MLNNIGGGRAQLRYARVVKGTIIKLLGEL